MLSSVLPSFFIAFENRADNNQVFLIDSLVYLSELTDENEAIVSMPENGHLITYFSKRKRLLLA